jgi:transcriptional regulator of acetoin/glycerol metabolism
MALEKHVDMVIDPLKSWEAFKEVVNEDPAMRPITIKAWKRCQDINMTPNEIEYKFLSKQELKEKVLKYEYLIKIAEPYLKYLSASLTGIPHVVALSDQEGWIISIYGSIGEEEGRKVGLCIGSSWNEEIIGNNGIGTSLRQKEPVFIYGVEHYVEVYKSWSCLGVPIHQDGKIIGALDVSVDNPYAHPSRMAVATACVNSIENELARKHREVKTIQPEEKTMATTDLIATAVHDLKNPLAVMRGLGDLGVLLSSSNKERHYFNKILKQVEVLNNTIVDLLNIFKPKQPTLCNPSTIIEEVVEEIIPSCYLNHIEVTFEDKCSEVINLYDTQFKRAIQNLLDNAIKEMPEGGNLYIKTEIKEDKVFISIKDTGKGVPIEIEKELFQAYVHGRKDGTGLGLFMVHHVIKEIHKGDIWYTSKGEGTTFFITLPLNK